MIAFFFCFVFNENTRKKSISPEAWWTYRGVEKLIFQRKFTIGKCNKAFAPLWTLSEVRRRFVITEIVIIFFTTVISYVGINKHLVFIYNRRSMSFSRTGTYLLVCFFFSNTTKKSITFISEYKFRSWLFVINVPHLLLENTRLVYINFPLLSEWRRELALSNFTDQLVIQIVHGRGRVLQKNGFQL